MYVEVCGQRERGTAPDRHACYTWVVLHQRTVPQAPVDADGGLLVPRQLIYHAADLDTLGRSLLAILQKEVIHALD